MCTSRAHIAHPTFNCDAPSNNRLVLLSQLSPTGYREANKLIDKMLKMVSSGKGGKLGNPSAFVTTGVQNARDLLTPESEYYAGNGNYW